MSKCNKMTPYGTYQIERSGINISALLDKISGLGLATHSKDGLMSAADKEKLDCLGTTTVRYNTTAYWNAQVGYIPAAGDIIIYSDFKTHEEDGETIYTPGIKVGSGNAYVQDLAFINDSDADYTEMIEHMANTHIHITDAERAYWNNKLNVNDLQEVVGESLVFNRN